MQAEPRRDRWLRPAAEQGQPASLCEQSKPPGSWVLDRWEPPPILPPFLGKKERFLGPGPAREARPGAPDTPCAAGTRRRLRRQCNSTRGGLQAPGPAAASSSRLRPEWPPLRVCLRRDRVAGFPPRSQRPAPAVPGRPARLQPAPRSSLRKGPGDKGAPAAGA